VTAEQKLLSKPWGEIAKVKLTDNIDARLFVYGRQTLDRYKTYYQKEPDTIRWLDELPQMAVLWDIGANIGLYSIYPALTRAAQVLAFEPGAPNYFVLNRNIEANGLDQRITAFCLAFSDTEEIGTLNMGTTKPGGASAAFEDDHGDMGQKLKVVFQQGMVGITVDAFIKRYNPPFPEYMKIDVDGLEHKIIRGMTTTLADRRLQGLWVELDSARPDYVAEVSGIITKHGFELVGSYRSPTFAPKSPIRNYKFRRTNDA